MQGSFEKRVQEKLEELKLTPSEPVWKNIEKEIKPEKRRRFPFWIPFVIVLLAGTGWWLLSGKEQEAAADSATVPVASAPAHNETNQNANTTTSNNVATTGTVQPANSSGTIANQSNDQTNSTAANSLSGTTQQGAKTDHRSSISYASPSKKNTTVKGKWVASSRPANNNAKATVGFSQTNDSQKTGLDSGNVETSTNPQSITSQSENTTTAIVDSVAGKQENLPVNISAKPVDTAAAKKKVAAVQKGWRKTVTLEGGWSQSSTGGFFAGSGRRELYYASPSQGNNYGGNVGLPSAVSNGAAFRAGAGLSKTLGKHWEFSAGLTYAYYSTHSHVGGFKPIDTAFASFNGDVAVGGYYYNTNQQDYTTRYHMLELPVSIGFRPFSRLPLTLSAGALYGRLLHTNALSFNPWMNIYYKDEGAVRKNFFAGFSSLQFTVLKNTNWQLDIGPVVQYHFSPVKKDSSSSQHLSFAGLKTTIRF